MPPRLIDLHCDWLLQYAHETTTFDPLWYPSTAGRLPQADGYLLGATAAVIACSREAGEWQAQADPWQALGELLARVEAEFPGRLLIGPDDHARWRDDPEGLAWGVLGVDGFDSLVRAPVDLDRLPGLFERGVRVFQMVQGPSNALAGSTLTCDDRGLTQLGRDFLPALAGLGRDAGPRPALDLAHLNARATADVLDWYEAAPTRVGRLPLLRSHGGPLPGDILGRLRTLGGLVGFGVSPPFFESPDALEATLRAAAELPFLGRKGFEGVGIGTAFLGTDTTWPELANVERLAAWVATRFTAAEAEALLAGNARKALRQITGARDETCPT